LSPYTERINIKMKNIGLTLFENAINQYLQLDPEVPKKLGEHAGKIVRLTFRGVSIQFDIQIMKNCISLLNDAEVTPDTEIIGTPLALVGLGMSKGAAKANYLFSKDVTINGDIELGQELQRTLDNMAIDWEELLSKITGDIIAHHFGNCARATVAWGQKAASSLQKNTTEYLQEEIMILPQREALDDFYRDIDELRNDVERIDMRIEQAKQNSERKSD